MEYNNFGLLKFCTFLTALFAVLKYAGVLVVSTLFVFAPIIFALSMYILFVFIIGLITLYYGYNGVNNKDQEEDNNTDEA